MPRRRKKPSKPKPLPKILVTGFEPFGKWKENPSGWAVRQLMDNDIRDVDLVRVVLPVHWKKADLAMRDLLKRFKPDAVVQFGLSPKRPGISIEMLALNMDHCDDPDNAGRRRLRKKIEPRGPVVMDTTLPTDRILRALKRADVPAGLSYHAGTYVCNHVFYVLMHGLRKQPKVPAGFIHLPPIRRLIGIGISEWKLTDGVHAILNEVAGVLKKKTRRRR
ncbi:MAG: pyroglutamyl-peptidase I [Planctomycetota bacterium]|jgi:pyroglutamyl-peptidase